MSNYTAKQQNEHGHVNYSAEENETWQMLVERQMQIIQDHACPEFLDGLEKLNLPQDRVPQCFEVTEQLQKTTGWSVKPVAALISLQEFFTLLSNKQFPAATFIRKREELDYLKEPDIFHEFFGHCPLLTNQAYADFVQWYGKTALTASAKIQSLLGRVFWFTIEFGLVQANDSLRIYGGGILSSFEETQYALERSKAKHLPFNIDQVLKTPYRYDQIQQQYFILQNIQELYTIQKLNLITLATQVMGEKNQNDFNVC